MAEVCYWTMTMKLKMSEFLATKVAHVENAAPNLKRFQHHSVRRILRLLDIYGGSPPRTKTGRRQRDESLGECRTNG